MFPIRIDVLDLIQRTYRYFNWPEPKDFPPIEKMANYGLPACEQYFKREVYPDKLLQLESKIRKRPSKSKETHIKRELDTINLFYEALETERDKYRKEIDWIERQWYYRLFGYWVMINGKPTYLVGTHWWYLNYWYLDTVLPEYRDRDRRWFMAARFAFLDTTTFKNIDPKTRKPIPDEKGNYDMIDLGRRVCYGTNNPKSRRVGDTSKSECDACEEIIRRKEGRHGIQGKDDKNAETVFSNHFVKPFRKLPIIWKPMFNALDPKKELAFVSDDIQVRMDTKVDFATTADRSHYDGEKLIRYHRDEPGKCKYEDINKAHKVVRECLSLGDEIIGFTQYTTTVDEMNQRGGTNYLKLSKGSHYQLRDKNGRTRTGLYNIFFPARDGLQGFVGPYGESVIDTPTNEQALFIKKSIGAREFLANKREAMKLEGDIESLNEEKRLFPEKFRECFTPPAKNVFFRMDILEERIGQLRFGDPLVRRGDLIWSNGKFTTVEWRDNEEDGRFYLSYMPPDGQTNMFFVRDEQKFPISHTPRVVGIDAFRLEKTEGSRMSNGGIAVFWGRDLGVDPLDKDIREWESNRFILTYSHRPETTDEFAEDALKVCIWLNAMAYPENNIDLIEKKFSEWGYGGYLLYDVDFKTGKMKKNAGWYSTISTKQDLFNLHRDHIKDHGLRERHEDYLTECMAIPSIDKMTDYDLFTACGGALRGINSQQLDWVMQEFKLQDSHNSSDGWLPVHSY